MNDRADLAYELLEYITADSQMVTLDYISSGSDDTSFLAENASLVGGGDEPELIFAP